ncbi:PREDICTED: probably inactive leucine-rich repeat receptor-like protein kinase At2g25790 [Camelina sativa]|uniref:Probably inactive leucine-rich repeat receptor-like protein kinase At2g25790 n=1 Tax=Camelina sativa TaxID=90675 RepID=A0ABM0WKZ9_CAMSA|nr:PREDICTED: probably inactive leucine-rich repeat receptor-like protein kinase At2g25790 [Camelina sativa]
MSTSHHHHQPPYLITTLFFLFLNFSCLHANELELLLSFKASIQDPLRHLSSWSTNDVCLWNGIVCNNFSRVVSLDLSTKNISGQILNSTTFRLPFLRAINLSNNNLSGPIPHDIFTTSSPSLRYLNLSNNNFSGSIPRGFLPNLYTLDLSNNMLTGEIYDDIGFFSNLRVLDLGGNVLTGHVPTYLGNLSRLEFLTLASNQLTGGIPAELWKMNNLKWIYLGYNNLSGAIPYQIGGLSSLNHLDLVYNNLSGPIPPSLGDLKKLQYMFLYQNKLSGQIPLSIFSLKNLISLDFSDNLLSGEIPELVAQMKSLEILHLFSNSLTGTIPEGVTSLPRLKVLQLWSNNFSGGIPANLGKHSNLTVLDLSTNNLTGKLPDTLCESGHLTKLILFSNSLDGQIPPSLGTCPILERVRLQNNGFSGELPRGFTKLQLVNFLDLSNNNLQGNISTWDMPQLEMLNLSRNNFSGDLPDLSRSKRLKKLDLSRNKISGRVPLRLMKFPQLMDMDLSDNEITGVIPSDLSSCKNLVNLDLSHNNLTGEIPSSFSEFPVLSVLDLSCNRLSGEIPKNLGNIESLVQVNISHNLLHGSLPSSGAFLAINETAVAGNSDLCSENTASGLRPCKIVRKRSTKSWWFVVTSTFVAFLAVLVCGFFIAPVFQRKHNVLVVKKVEQEDGTKWEIQFFDSRFMKSHTVKAILSSLKDENVFADKNGMQFVVKEVKKYDALPEMSEMKKISEHKNILKLVATCRSEKVAYLIHENVEGERLSQILNGLSWERRRKIMISIAEALRFLHCRCSMAVVAGNLSPENIVIDVKYEPRLCLGLPGLLCMDAAYIALETREHKEMTSKSEIYGFGILLLHLLTGKSFSGDEDIESKVNGSLVNWARYSYLNSNTETWIDSSIDTTVHQRDIVHVMSLALNCTAIDPQERPCIKKVLQALESTSSSSSFCISYFPKIRLLA